MQRVGVTSRLLALWHPHLPRPLCRGAAGPRGVRALVCLAAAGALVVVVVLAAVVLAAALAAAEGSRGPVD